MARVMEELKILQAMRYRNIYIYMFVGVYSCMSLYLVFSVFSRVLHWVFLIIYCYLAFYLHFIY